MSINLTATNHLLELVTTGTGAVHVVASFIDDNAGTKTGGSQSTVISTATTTTIVSAPGASIQRSVHHINIQAVAGNTVTIQKDVAATDHTLLGPVTLTAGQRLEFTASVGWKRTEPSGSSTVAFPAEVVQVYTTSGTSNDVSLNAATTILRVDTGNSAWRITGFSRAGGNVDGDRITVENASNTASTGGFLSQTGSVAGNQIVTPQNIERAGMRYSAELIYDGTDNVWRVVHETGWEATALNLTGASHTIDVTGAVNIDADAASHVATSVGNLTLQTTEAGSRVIVSGADDVLIEAVADDIFLNSGGLTQFTSGTAITLNMATLFRVTTNSVERLEIEDDGAWQVDGNTGTSGQVLTSSGNAASPEWVTPKKLLTACQWHEDFECVNGSSATGPHHFGQTVWITTALSTSGSVVAVANEQHHPGIVSVQTDGLDNSVYCIHRGGPNADDPWVRGDEIKEFNVVCRLNTSGNLCAFFIGFSENTANLSITTNNDHIMGFFHDSDTDSTIHCITRESAGTATDTDSGTTPGTSWKKYTIRQTAVGTVEFLIDGTIVATHSTQVPDSESMNCGITIVARSAAIAQMYVDYVDFESHPLTR